MKGGDVISKVNKFDGKEKSVNNEFMLKRAMPVLLMAIVIWCNFALPVFAEPGDPVWDRRVKEEIDKQKMEKQKQHQKVPPILIKLEDVYKSGGEEGVKKFAKYKDLRIKEGNKVFVKIVLKLGLSGESFDTTVFESYGGEIIHKSSWNYVSGYLPIDKLRKIADEVSDVEYLENPTSAKPESFQSEGVRLTGAHSYLSSLVTGSGVKAAVIDLGFAGLSSAISNSDIPGNVVKIDCTGTNCATDPFSFETEEHGTAVAEIVHDMAPSAALYLIKVDSKVPLTLNRAVTYCKNNGIRIINHSVGWYNQNFYDGACYDDNAVCSANYANDNSTGKGILFVKSAGNSAQRHYYATYSDPGRLLGWHNTSPTIAANAEATITIDFTWDAWPTTNQDFDIYLMYYNEEGFLETCDSGALPQTGSQSPTESLSCDVDATRTYYVYIVKQSANTDPRFHIFSSSHNINPAVAVAARSLTSPADASGAFAVGAIHWNSWLTGSVENYSSQGPTSDGKIKPDIMGRHFHNGSQENVAAAPFPAAIHEGFRAFMEFIKDKLAA